MDTLNSTLSQKSSSQKKNKGKKPQEVKTFSFEKDEVSALVSKLVDQKLKEVVKKKATGDTKKGAPPTKKMKRPESHNVSSSTNSPPPKKTIDDMVTGETITFAHTEEPTVIIGILKVFKPEYSFKTKGGNLDKTQQCLFDNLFWANKNKDLRWNIVSLNCLEEYFQKQNESCWVVPLGINRGIYRSHDEVLALPDEKLSDGRVIPLKYAWFSNFLTAVEEILRHGDEPYFTSPGLSFCHYIPEYVEAYIRSREKVYEDTIWKLKALLDMRYQEDKHDEHASDPMVKEILSQHAASLASAKITRLFEKESDPTMSLDKE